MIPAELAVTVVVPIVATTGNFDAGTFDIFGNGVLVAPGCVIACPAEAPRVSSAGVSEALVGTDRNPEGVPGVIGTGKNPFEGSSKTGGSCKPLRFRVHVFHSGSSVSMRDGTDRNGLQGLYVSVHGVKDGETVYVPVEAA